MTPVDADPGPSAPAGANAGRAAGGRDGLWLLAVCLPWAWLVGRFWYVTDDAFISFRYARNWAEGLGLRYNPGEDPPVEGFSNFLWVALSAVVERLGLDPVACMPALSAACAALLVGLVLRALRQTVRLPRATALLVTFSMAGAAPFVVWSTSGLETMSFALLLFLAFERAVLRDPPAAAQSGLFALLVALSRPEGVWWALIVAAVAVAARRARRPRDEAPDGNAAFRWRRFLAVLVPGYAVYLAWRLATFGHLLPTSATAKLTAGVGPDRLARGLAYVGLQFLTTLSLFALVPSLALAFRSGRRAVALPVAAFALGFPVWSIVVSGDFMAFGRFLVPGLPFLALLVGWLCRDLGRGGAPFAAALCVLGLLPALGVHPVPREVRAALDIRPHLGGFRSELEYWSQQKTETLRWADRGRALALISNPGESIALSAIGAVGYYSRLFVFDRVGLVTREVAERVPEGDAREFTPGHDDPVPTVWFLEQGYRPTFVKANFHGARSTEELAAKVAKSLDNLERVGLAPEYFLDVYRVEREGGDPTPESRGYFFVWRHPPPRVSAAQAARSFEQRMERHLAGGDLRGIRLPASRGAGGDDDDDTE